MPAVQSQKALGDWRGIPTIQIGADARKWDIVQSTIAQSQTDEGFSGSLCNEVCGLVQAVSKLGDLGTRDCEASALPAQHSAGSWLNE